MTSISISLDQDLVEWLDLLIKQGIIKNRSEAVRGGVYAYIREQLPIQNKADLRDYLKKKQQKIKRAKLPSGTEVIKDVREEE